MRSRNFHRIGPTSCPASGSTYRPNPGSAAPHDGGPTPAESYKSNSPAALARYGSVPLNRAEWVRIAAARHRELVCSGARWRHAVYLAAAAVGRGHGLARRIRILRWTNRKELVDIALQRQMRSLAADICHGHYRFLGDLTLDIEIPLLHVRPDRLGGNGRHSQRECHAAAPNVGVAGDVILRRADYIRRAAFQRLGVAFIPVGVLKEDAVTGSNRRSPISKRVEGEAYARRGVE